MPLKARGFGPFTPLTLAVLAVAWLLLAPVQIGGQALYLVVSGISMEPTLYEGDLLAMRPSAAYRVGDIATYYHPRTGAAVVHRIVAQTGQRFVFQGDNKHREDPYAPEQAEVRGKLWWRLPRVGGYLMQVRQSPLLFTGLGSLVIFFLLAPLVQPQRRAQRKQPWRQTAKEQTRMTYTGRNQADILFFLVVLALASTLLGWFVFTRPVTVPVTDSVPYTHTGTFHYSAAAPPGIYNSNAAQTGEPIFRQLITRFTLNFDYQLSTEAAAEVAGEYRLMAELSQRNGWRRSFELLPWAPFEGTGFSLSREINLAEIEQVIDNLEQQTGQQNGQYSLALMPEVTLSGTLGGYPLRSDFAPRLAFELDPAQLQLADQDSAQLEPAQAGSIPYEREAANVIGLAGFNLAVTTVRFLAGLGLVLALAGLGLAGWYSRRALRGDEAGRIQSRYGSLLVNVRPVDLDQGQLIETASIDDLARLAERDGQMLLHQVQGSTHCYLVKEGSLTYYYQAKGDKE